MFSRDVRKTDLIEMPVGASSDASGYIKHEESIFVNKILKRSRGKMRIKLDFGDIQNNDDSSSDLDTNFDFGKEFESNGSYLIEKAYCKRRIRRNTIFSDLKAPNVKKATLMATIDLC